MMHGQKNIKVNMLIKIITVSIARLIIKVIIKTTATLLTKTDINVRKSS